MSDASAGDTHRPASRRIPTGRRALTIALWYAALGLLWIACSGRALHYLVHDEALAAMLEYAKGCCFVAATALVLGLALNRYFQEIRRSRQLTQDGEERLHLIGDTLADGYVFQFIHDPGGTPQFTYISAGVERVHGVKAADILRDPGCLRACIDPAQLAAIQAAREESVRQVKEFAMEIRARRADGGWGLIRLRARPRRNLEGRIQWEGIALEVTERREAESALRESEARYRLLSENSRDVIWLFDLASNRFSYVSPSIQRLRGYTVEEVQGETLRDALTPESYRLVAEAIPERLAAFRAGDESARTHVHEVTQPHKNGSKVATEVVTTFITGDDGRVTHIQGVTRDITERKRTEAALRQSESEFRAMFELASIGMGQMDPRTGHWLRVNQRLCAITGYTAGELRQLPMSALTPPEDRERVQNLFQRFLAGEAPEYSLEQRCLRKDGSPAWVSANMAVIRDNAAHPVAAMATLEDVTARRELEAQLRQAQKLEAVAQLAGGVAHDFNNILAAILTRVGLLRGDPGLAAEAREGLRELELEARRAATLTRQLLIFSRRSVLSLKMLDINTLVEDLLKMLRRLIGEHILLGFEGDSNLPMVEGDSGMLEQVLMNLVFNARDAMPGGGRITIRTGLSIMDEALAGANPERRPGRFVCLSVADTGCGMDAGTLKRSFEPFFTTKEPGKGTGLGLATVHGIVGQHKGWVEVESRPGGGAVFQVLLPAAQAAPEAGPALTFQPLTSFAGHGTILLVEDEPAVRRNVAQLLVALGYKVLPAQNATEARELWDREKIGLDLLLTDVALPAGATGIALAEKFQAEKPSLKVILSSGYSYESVKEGLPPGLRAAYFAKPYDAWALGSTIRACLAGENPGRDAGSRPVGSR